MADFGNRIYEGYKSLHPALKINSLALVGEVGGASMMGLIPGISAFGTFAGPHILGIMSAVSELKHN